LLQVAELGLGAFWKHISPELRDQAKAILAIPGPLTIVNLIPVGYPDETLPPHAESDFDVTRVHRERW
jgi:nitroreductase